MPLFGSHDVTHLIQERKSPGLAGSGEKQNAPTAPGSAAQALDGVGLD